MSDVELWKSYPEFDFIEGSNFGHVRIIDRWVKTSRGNGKRLIKGYMLKQWCYKNGYLFVKFKVNGNTVNRLVHRIIASCFLQNKDGLPEINHMDCNPKNNVVSNLEWCTPEYNIEYREKYGVAQNHPVIAINTKTLETLQFHSQSEAGRVLHTYNQSVNAVVKGRIKQTGGFWFTNADKNAVEIVNAKFGDKVARKVDKLMSEKLFATNL